MKEIKLGKKEMRHSFRGANENTKQKLNEKRKQQQKQMGKRKHNIKQEVI